MGKKKPETGKNNDCVIPFFFSGSGEGSILSIMKDGGEYLRI